MRLRIVLPELTSPKSYIAILCIFYMQLRRRLIFFLHRVVVWLLLLLLFESDMDVDALG